MTDPAALEVDEEGVMIAGLCGLDVEAALRIEDGVGFCKVSAAGITEAGLKILLNGMLDPDTVRTMALGWLAAAEASELDQHAFAIMVETMTPDVGEPEVDPKIAAASFVMQIRERRAQPVMET